MASASATIPVGYKKTEVGVIPEDWHVVNIDSIARVKTGAKDTQDKIDDGDFPFFVRSQKVERINSFSFDGEAVLTAGDGVGTGKIFHYIVGKFDYHQRVYCMSGFSNCTGKYFYYQFSHNFYDRIMSMTAKSSVDSVRKAMITEMHIPLPPEKTEQDKIAKTLSDSDSQIQALEQLIAKKRDIKQGSMQTLLTGKSRLPGYNGEWISSLMPNICWFQEGPGVRNTQFVNSGVKLLNGTNIFQGHLYLERTDRYISEHEAYGVYSHFLANSEDIVIACSGITIKNFHKKIAVVKEWHLPLCMNTSTMRFQPKKDKLEKQYLFQYLMSDNFKQQISGKATGSAQLNFGPSHVAKVRIDLPPLAEQRAIAQVLSDMDAEIAALEQRLEKTKAIKQGMMQQLLTGRIRLVDPSTPVEASA